MADYTILTPVELPEHCYLLEALYWRAFGRAPVEYYSADGTFRDSSDSYEGFEVPNMSGEELSVEECNFAGLPSDPRMQALINNRATLPVEWYKKFIKRFELDNPQDVDSLSDLRRELDEAKTYHIEVQKWMPILQGYLDEFKAEICLDLKRGKLTGYGRLLPYPSPEESLGILEGNNDWFESLTIAAIPSKAWVTTDIDWVAGAIYGQEASYIWILISVTELLNAYPPTLLIKPENVSTAGSSVFVSGLSTRQADQVKRRGRPAYDWDSFHVEVARLYANGEMPQKKEAAIALMQEWFEREMGKSVSRSAVGMKLKSYFDKLGKKSKS